MPVVEMRRNGMVNPKPTVFAGSQWVQPSTGSITADGVTSTLTSTTTPYIFTAPRAGGATLGRVYAFRAKVRAAVASGSAASSILIRPHKRVGNVYYATTPALSVPTDGVQREIFFYWQATGDIANADGFELSGVANGSALAGSTLSIDDVLIEDVGTTIPTVPPGPFFYGGTPGVASLDGAAWDSFSWSGAVGNSESVMTRDIRLTTLPDMNPVPRVLVDAGTALFPAGSVTVSLMRTAEGRTFDVRGGQRLPAGSPAVVLDAEAPFGVVSTYTVFGYDVAGNLVGSFPVGTVTLNFAGTVVQQPLDARLSVRLDRQDGTGFELARTTPGTTVYAQGQVLPGLVGLGPRRGLQNVTMNLVVESAADADKLQATLGTYETRQIPVWLVRTPPDQRIPRVFFCHVPQLVEMDTYRHTNSGLVQYQATVEEVRPPATGVTAAVLTHSDMKVFFTTHTGVKARYATHADIKRDTSLVGAANA